MSSYIVRLDTGVRCIALSLTKHDGPDQLSTRRDKRLAKNGLIRPGTLVIAIPWPEGKGMGCRTAKDYRLELHNEAKVEFSAIGQLMKTPVMRMDELIERHLHLHVVGQPLWEFPS